MTENPSFLVRSTPVGRKAEIDRVMQEMQGELIKPSIFFVSGDGGRGKTIFINQVLAAACSAAESNQEILVVDSPIDLYHFSLHIPENFIDFIVSMIRLVDSKAFQKYPEAKTAFNRARQSGKTEDVPEKYTQLRNAFMEGIKELASKRLVVLAFDTLERLSVTQPSSNENKLAGIWPLLIEMLHSMPKGVVLLAGRELDGAGDLIREARHRDLYIEDITLKPFQPGETLDYVKSVVSDLKTYNLREEEIDAIGTLTEGEPILLSLFLQAFLNGLLKPSTVIEEARRYKQANDLETKKETLKKYKDLLIKSLLEISDTGEVIKYLARAARGMDAEMLAQLLNREVNRVNELIDGLEKLTFVKKYTLAEDRYSYTEKLWPRRIFLHDILGQMIRDHLSSEANDVKDRKLFYDFLEQYYEEKNRENAKALTDLYRDGKENEAISWRELLRTQLYSEMLYYSLRMVASEDKGLKYLVRYLHEGFITNNDQLLKALRIELSAFHRKSEVYSNAGQAEYLDWTLQKFDALIQCMTDSLPMRNDLEAFTKIYTQLEQKVEKDPAKGGPAYQVLRQVVTIYEHMNNPYLYRTEAEEKLREAQRKINEARLKKVNSCEWLDWLDAFMLGLSERVLAYIYRNKGLHGRSIGSYQQALAHFSNNAPRAEIATARNELGFSFIRQGDYGNAEANIRIARHIREELGLSTQLGMTYHTLAIWNLAQGAFADAMQAVNIATNIFTSVKFERGIAMSSRTKAEIIRRQVSAQVQPPFNLHHAIDLAETAIYLSVLEEIRNAEAHIEAGCCERDRLRFDDTLKNAPYQRDRVAKTSAEHFAKAIEICRHDPENNKLGFQDQETDARVNLAWMYFYWWECGSEAGLEKLEQVLPETAKRLEALIREFLPTFVLDKPPAKDDVSKRKETYESLSLFLQLGKLYALKGTYYLKRWNEQKLYRRAEEAEKELYNAVKSYVLGLEYNIMYGEDYHALRQAKNRIFDVINSITNQERRRFLAMVDVIEKELDIEPEQSVMHETLRVNGYLLQTAA